MQPKVELQRDADGRPVAVRLVATAADGPFLPEVTMMVTLTPEQAASLWADLGHQIRELETENRNRPIGA